MLYVGIVLQNVIPCFCISFHFFFWKSVAYQTHFRIDSIILRFLPTLLMRAPFVCRSIAANFRMSSLHNLKMQRKFFAALPPFTKRSLSAAEKSQQTWRESTKFSRASRANWHYWILLAVLLCIMALRNWELIYLEVCIEKAWFSKWEVCLVKAPSIRRLLFSLTCFCVIIMLCGRTMQSRLKSGAWRYMHTLQRSIPFISVTLPLASWWMKLCKIMQNSGANIEALSCFRWCLIIESQQWKPNDLSWLLTIWKSGKW